MKRLLLLLAGAGLAACHQATPAAGPTPPPVAAQTSAAASAGAAGIYQGLLPCADCAGIQTTLYLYPDSTYEETLLYLGHATPTAFSTSGQWQQAPDHHLRLTNRAGRAPTQYRLTPTGLQQLDGQGQPITGALAGRYHLSRTGAL